MKALLPENEAARLEVLPKYNLDTALEISECPRPAAAQQRTQKHKVRFFKSIAVGFGLSSAILLGIGLLSYQSTTKLIKNYNEVIHAQKVLEKIEDIIFNLKDAETGQRGYIITGKKSYLKPYFVGLENVARKVKTLRELTADNPNQQRRLDTLEPLIAKKLAELKQTIDLRTHKGFSVASQVILTDKGKNLMDNIHRVLNEMEKAENNLLVKRSQAAASNARATIFESSSAILLSFFITVGVYYSIYRELIQRKRIETVLEQERDFTSIVLDTSSALVVVLDSQGRIVRFNHACEKTTGYAFDEVKSKYFWDLFLLPEEAAGVKAIFKELLSGQFPNQHENHWVTRDGDRRLIAWSNTVLYDIASAAKYVIGSGIDITERKRVEEQVNLLQALMLAVGECRNFESALAVVLRTVCETKDWNYGEAWIPCPDKSVLKCSSAWYSRADGKDKPTFPILERFRKLSEEFTFPLGIGLPGRVWSSQQPEWQHDVSLEPEINFLRAQLARDCGLRSGLGIPLLVNEHVLAVLVFFKFESFSEDIRLIETISAVTKQLGSVIERKRMEQVLRESEERFKAFMNNSPTVAFIKDEEGHFVYINEQFERVFKIKEADWLGKTDFDLWSEEIALQLRENDTRVLAADKTVEIVESVPTPDGCLRHWLSFKFPCLDGSGRRLLGGVAIDITERQQAKEALLESQTRLSLINSISTAITLGMSVEQVIESTVKQISGYFKSFRVAYSTIDQQGTLSVLYSIEPPGMAQLTGNVTNLSAAPEYLNVLNVCKLVSVNNTLHVCELVIVEDVAQDSRLAPLADAMKACDTQAILEVQLQHSEQLLGKLSFDSPSPKKWTENEIVTLREVAEYLSVAIKEANAQQERQRAESELREMSVALENAVEGIARLDTQGCYISVNRAYASMVGYQPEEMIGMEWQATVHPEDRENMMAAYQSMLMNGKLEAEARGVHKDGSVFYKQVTMVSAYDQQQQFIGHYCFMKDITERKRTDAALQQANEKLTSWVNELEQRNREIALLGEISDVLQACFTVEEAYSALTTLVQPLFPDTKGGIFLISASKNLVEAVATWGSPPLPSQDLFIPHECWALRRGQAHWVEDAHNGLQCKHVYHDELLTESLCVPMMAQGEAMGVLFLSPVELGRLTQTKQQLASTVAEHIALSLANLKLRATLQNQSIRDPLTGLFNRRYMEESLERELRRCERLQQPLSIIMIDADQFKRFNDMFGHEAGDAVLRELGLLLQSYVRGSDIACRYGGEELTLILPEASLDVTCKRAEQLRQGAKHLQIRHHDQLLGGITLSLGVACFPEHGITASAMMQAAEAALYYAKASERDAVKLAS